MALIDLRNLGPEEMNEYVASLDEKPFRASQIKKWVFRSGVDQVSVMTDLSKELREKITRTARISQHKCLNVETSSDGSRKFLWRMDDGARVETVLIPEKDHYTLCVSTQAGCAMGCKFCRTGALGLKRNLNQAEIINQVLGAKKALGSDGNLTNIVLMGMGEPLANLNNVVSAIKLLTDQDLMEFSRRKLSLSTVGIVPALQKLGDEITVGLTISLNAADDETRDKLMPINKTYPMADLHKALEKFPLPNRRMITIAYVLLAGVNDSQQQARKLTKYLAGLKCKINLIPFNEYPGSEFKKPDEKSILRFQEILISKNYTTMVRTSKGQDISAACGQLAAS